PRPTSDFYPAPFYCLSLVIRQHEPPTQTSLLWISHYPWVPVANRHEHCIAAAALSRKRDDRV
ncbi:MAG: hypothetical protein WC406_09130, partial [Methanoregula sp.]